jgi:hypothetical protein
MTTIMRQDIKCAVCGSINEYSLLGSTNSFGSPDLDLRPPEMQRSTMSMWIQECPDCGYCCTDISESSPTAGEIISTERYKSLGVDNRYPNLARKFLKFACLIENDDKLASALNRLRAAWVCDDEVDKADEAKYCRSLSILDLSSLLPFEDSERGVTQAATLVDLLRRSGRFEEAVEFAEKFLPYESVNNVIKAIFNFQIQCCGERNEQCFTVADAYSE